MSTAPKESSDRLSELIQLSSPLDSGFHMQRWAYATIVVEIPTEDEIADMTRKPDIKKIAEERLIQKLRKLDAVEKIRQESAMDNAYAKLKQRIINTKSMADLIDLHVELRQGEESK